MRTITFEMKKTELSSDQINEFTKDFVSVNLKATGYGFKNMNPITELSPAERQQAADFIFDYIRSEECLDKDKFELFCEAQSILNQHKNVTMLFRPKVAAFFPFDDKTIDLYSKYKKQFAAIPEFKDYDNYPSII